MMGASILTPRVVATIALVLLVAGHTQHGFASDVEKLQLFEFTSRPELLGCVIMEAVTRSVPNVDDAATQSLKATLEKWRAEAIKNGVEAAGIRFSAVMLPGGKVAYRTPKSKSNTNLFKPVVCAPIDKGESTTNEFIVSSPERATMQVGYCPSMALQKCIDALKKGVRRKTSEAQLVPRVAAWMDDARRPKAVAELVTILYALEPLVMPPQAGVAPEAVMSTGGKLVPESEFLSGPDPCALRSQDCTLLPPLKQPVGLILMIEKVDD